MAKRDMLLAEVTLLPGATNDYQKGIMMKTRTVFYLLTALILCASDRVTAANETSQTTQAEKEVLQAEQARRVAVLASDVQALDRLWHENYRQVTWTGDLRTKLYRLAVFREGLAKYQSITNEDVEVRIFGDTAVVTGLTTRKGKEGKYDVSGVFRFSRVWIKQEGRWQAILLQYTRLAQP